MTPFEKAGYKPEDRFKVIGGHYCLKGGSIVQLKQDDGTEVPLFKVLEEAGVDGYEKGTRSVYVYLSNLKKLNSQPQVITRNTELTITATASEWARVYAVMGRVNGVTLGDSVWVQLDSILGVGDVDYNTICAVSNSLAVINYTSHQSEWERAIFQKQDEKAKKIRELKTFESKVEALRKELGLV